MTAAGEVQSPKSNVQSSEFGVGRQPFALASRANRDGSTRPWTLDFGPGTRAARPDPLFHLVLLVLSTGVLLLAALLSVRGGT